ncbi:MAG TPA: hypothetical protein DCZ03_08270 [Gammaproteobacteria bacterium]|nr:hypothetical protein [Gammaproteobacteria bacterium]
MAWFSFRRRTPNPITSIKVEGNASHISRLAAQSLAAMAQVLDIFANDAFDIEDQDAGTFKRQSKDWAQHILTGITRKKKEEPQISSLSAPQLNEREREWDGLEKFIRARRKLERDSFENQSDALKSVVWELVHGLRTMSQTGYSSEGRIQKGLVDLESAMENNSVEKLQKAIKPVVVNIRAALDEQRKQFDSELNTMTSLVSKMRRELVATRRDAEIDKLTQLYNRRAFDAALNRHVDLAELSGRQLTLMMIDLDHFKSINDCYGHPAGDALLAATANQLTRALPRKSDFLSRFGGEEFAVIVFDVPEESATKLAQTVLKKVKEMQVEHEDHLIQITCSIGYASLEPGESADELIKRADQALYAAKDAGRNCVISA